MVVGVSAADFSWGDDAAVAAAFANACAEARTLTGRPPRDRADDIAALDRRTPYVDDSAAEVIAEDIAHEAAERVARYHERNLP